MSPFTYLLLAIAVEVVGTTALRLTEGFTKPLPSLVVVIAYIVAFYLMSQALKNIPIGIAYAIWSGIGTIGIVGLGLVLFREKLDFTSLIGIAFIIIGVVLLNMVSQTSHI